MSKKSVKARALRDYIRKALGGVCKGCNATDRLEFHVASVEILPHHGLSGPDRANFYLHQMLRGNLELRCPNCHRIASLKQARARRALKLCLPPAPLQGPHFINNSLSFTLKPEF